MGSQNREIDLQNNFLSKQPLDQLAKEQQQEKTHLNFLLFKIFFSNFSWRFPNPTYFLEFYF